MRVLIRTDASVEIGSGHLMRCLTLADQLRSENAQVAFACSDPPGSMLELLQNNGYPFVSLPLASTNTGSQADDAKATIEAAGRLFPNGLDWLVVDHYGLDATWERMLRPHVHKLMVIDDLANRQHNCDLLLDQNLQEPGRYAELVPKTTRELIGPRYALLRPQFANARHDLRRRIGQLRRLFFFFGAADTAGATLKALAAVEMLGRQELAVDVVIGATNQYRETIHECCRGKCHITIHSQVKDMATLMAKADLFVGAGGTSSWERCCLGLPALVLATAKNQIAQSETLARAGAQLYLGHAEGVTVEHLARLIEEALQLPELLMHMAEQGQALVDGHGVRRVANHLLVATIRLRCAQAADSNAIFTWRNHPDTRRHAFDSTEINWETHERWFAEVLADPDRKLMIAEHNGQPIGVLRYDLEAGYGLVSIYLVPGLAGQGWGLRILLAGEHWLRGERPDVRVCDAEIAANNTASSAVFQAAGYLPYRGSFRKDMHDKL